MHVVSVVGARPQFVKLAPIHEALDDAGVRHSVVHTGQHYDVSMSDVHFRDFKLPDPDLNLGVGSGSHAEMTASILCALDSALPALRPDVVLVYGDTNSTLAGALAAVKRGVRVAHVEAGLRSFNREMPEEHNRVLTDHACDLLLAPTETAMAHLHKEGLGARAVLCGDVMADICLRTAVRVDGEPPPVHLPDCEFVLATVHRPYNTDDPARLADVIGALATIDLPVILPVHPRLRDRARASGISLREGRIVPVAPLDYSSLIFAAMRARAVVTDSGGLQKEAFLLRTPCTTVRTETEWPETLQGDWNRLAFDVSATQFTETVLRSTPEPTMSLPFGNGTAARAIVRVLVDGDGSSE